MKFVIFNGTEYIKDLIKSLMMREDIDYKIYDDVIENDRGIYIINNSLDMATRIREMGDWISHIILIDNSGDYGYTENLLRLEIVKTIEDLRDMLISSIEVMKKIEFSNKSICFYYKGESHLIPYDSILYIEKNINDNSSLIVTEKEEICITKSITSIYDSVDKNIFYKSHRSCLININKVKSIKYDKGIISFGKRKTDLLSRSKKRGLKEVIKNKFGDLTL